MIDVSLSVVIFTKIIRFLYFSYVC